MERRVMKKGAAGEKPGTERAAKRGCPMCGKPPAAKYRPFCSRRCADLDLGRWLKGRYAIPMDDAPGEAAAEEDEA